MSAYLTTQQVDQLLTPINPARVLSRDGMAYVAVHDVKAHLTRIFGFGRWSSEVIEQQLVFEEAKQMKNGKDGWYVCYRSVVRLTVCAPDGTVLATFTEGHVGDSTGPSRGDVHGNAVANSESYALKRCAAMLGDQFGLSLYDKGSKRALVKGTLVHPETPSEDVNGDAVESEGLDEARPPEDIEASPEGTPSTRQVSSPPASDQAGEQPAPGENPTVALPDDSAVDALRARVLAALEQSGQKALIELGRVGIDISKQRLAKAQTTTPDGKPVSLEVLLDGAMKIAGRKPHGTGNPHADAAAGEPVEVAS